MDKSHGYVLDSQTNFTVTTTSQQVLPVRNRRKYLFIQNQGTDDVFIQIRDSQGSTLIGKLIVPGASYEPIQVPVQNIYMIARSGSQTVFICEGGE